MIKNKILKSLLILVITMLFPITVYAASSTINVTSSSKQIVTGNTFTVYVNTYSSTSLGTYEYTLSYNSNAVRLVSASSGDCNPTYCIWTTNSSSGSKNITYSFTFKAVGTGSSQISVKSARVVTFAGSNTTVNISPVTVSVLTQEQLEASYSKDNTLKSLEVSGYKLSPSFNKNTTNYTVELDSTVESIKVNATRNDSKASITGTGTKKVSEGENIIKVIVTAENGSKKNYQITATVKELNPINIKIDDKDYIVVKKASLLEEPNNYEKKNLKINNTNVPSFYSDITKYTLIGVKDKSGNISLAIVNEDNTYSIYKEYKFEGLSFQVLDIKDTDIPKGYTKSSITLNEEEITSYDNEDKNLFPILYGMNLNNGKIGFYKYDAEENTLQRFNDKDYYSILDNMKQEYNLVITVIGIGLVLLIILFILFTLTNKKKKEKIKNKKPKKKQE